jgi:hypothetical protein
VAVRGLAKGEEDDMDPAETLQEARVPGYVGLATYCGLLLTGIGGIGMGVAAVFMAAESQAPGSFWIAAGLFWIAAALSFGMLVNAFLRK